jgi:flagellar basal-body rod modification protein FlgD
MSTVPAISTSTTLPAGSSKPAVAPGADLANKETFLKLLVAQIKNQNPLSPTDGVQFLSQLAQFSGLEQSIETNKQLGSIQTVLDTIAADAKAAATVTPKADASAASGAGDKKP